MFADYRAIALFHFVSLATFQVIAIAIADHASLVQYVSGKRRGCLASRSRTDPLSADLCL
ncbi:hypothetical protein [Coleofasciculus sp. F4-SAH-05]|uniref:hypothetical protein n=1 Tax=Coleofasciculus sp. F4-SAH-05 TaxID=3069525 RepID=UPI0032FE0BC7